MKVKKMFSLHIKCLLSITIVVMILFSSICVLTASAENAENSSDDVYIPRGDRIIVSLGDSYSAGEGIEPFYGQGKIFKEKIEDHDWLGHRSEKSWPGQLRLAGVEGEMKDNRDSHWFFVASTGATTMDIRNEQKITITKGKNRRDKKNRTIESYKSRYDFYYKKQPPQIDVFKNSELKDKAVDYVTMTMGGNDVGFANIVGNAAGNFGEPNALRDQLADTWDKFYGRNAHSDSDETAIRDNLITAYHDIDNAVSNKARIIIAGYPKLFNINGSGFLIDEVEADMIDLNVHLFNLAISNAVYECKSDGMKIYFASVEEAFDGHEAYTDDPYINQIELFKHSEDFREDFSEDSRGSQYSVHPNEIGAAVYARVINEVIIYLEDQRAPRKPDPRYVQIEDPGERDVALVLDVSGSMAGAPIENTKQAAGEFVDSVSGTEANISLVRYSDRASIACDFTFDKDRLWDAIEETSTGGGTNIDDGLVVAERMLSANAAGAQKKIIVLMSDGQANKGRTGDELIEYADSLKQQGIYIYTLGFFDALKGSEKAECQYVMEKIASDGCHYEVTDPESLVFFFGDIADQINGQKYIYVRIACPVDVTVFHNGEKLDSSEKELSTRASFGTLTFENADSGGIEALEDQSSNNSHQDEVKILRLKEGVDYDIRISGNGTGKMDYKIGFMDETGEYTDFRNFEGIDITPATRIDTLAAVRDTTIMNVDSDGNGKYDYSYQASANGTGEIAERGEVTGSNIGTVFVVSLIIFMAFISLVLFFKIRLERKVS